MYRPLKILRDVLTGFLLPRTYWEFRSRWRPIQAIIGRDDAVLHLESAQGGLALMERLGLLQGCQRSLGIGSGGGRLEYWLAKRVPVCCGVDVSLGMAKLARQNVPDPSAHFFVGSGADLAFFRDGEMDLVYSFIVFQHIGDGKVRAYFRETARVLRPGGGFLFQIVTDNRRRPHAVPFRERHPYAIRWRRVEEIHQWLEEAGLSLRAILRENGEEIPVPIAKSCEEESLLFLAMKPCPINKRQQA